MPFTGKREIYDLPGYTVKNLQAKIFSVFIHCSGKSQVLNLLSKSHLPSIRIERLNKYLKWQVYGAFELQSGVTPVLSSNLDIYENILESKYQIYMLNNVQLSILGTKTELRVLFLYKKPDSL